MAKNKGKSNVASFHGILHGLQEHWLHLMHAKQSKERRKLVYVAHEVVDGTDYPAFRSDLTGLGSGRNWLVRDGEPELTAGTAWIEAMMEIMTDCMSFHQRQRNSTKDEKIKIRYTPRKVKDREKKGKTDKKDRPQTDLMRETIDFRPDHSRVIQYLLEAGRAKHLIPVVAEIATEEIRLFEEVHPDRKVKSGGEHTDSGQYHFDHWHSGISEIVVTDHKAIVVDGAKGEEILESGEAMKIRMRNVFRNYGVGDGMASFDRHRSALEDDGRDAKAIMGHTLAKLEANTITSAEQNGEFPRDLRLWRAVDKFVDQKLRSLDPTLCDKARAEYADWIEAGYDRDKLGIEEETLQQSKHKRRKTELENLRAAVRVVLEMILAIPGVALLLQASKALWKKIDELSTSVAPTVDPSAEPKKRRSSRPTGNEDSEAHKK